MKNVSKHSHSTYPSPLNSWSFHPKHFKGELQSRYHTTAVMQI